jgi:hypothetical protein
MSKKNLYDQIKEEEAVLDQRMAAIAAGKDPDAVEDDVEEKDEDNQSEDQTEDQADDKAEEKETETQDDGDKSDQADKSEKTDEKTEKVFPTDRSEVIRLRQEAAEAKRRARELEQRQANPQQAQETKAVADPEPNKEENYEGWLEWNIRQLRGETEGYKKRFEQEDNQRAQQYQLQRAAEEIAQFEENFRQSTPDYDDAAEFMKGEIIKSIRISNPVANKQQIEQLYVRQVLNICGQFARADMDPAASMYQMAIDYGYTKAEARAAAADVTRVDKRKGEVELTRSRLDAIKNNKTAKTGLVAGGKTGTTPLTKEAALKMSNSEFSRLSAADLKQIDAMDA